MIATVKKAHYRVKGAPTPMAGLALGIASLGWSWENALELHHGAQWMGAVIASVLLVILAYKFLFHNHLLREDLAHPVVGSVVPTFAMATMVVSHSVGQFLPRVGDGIWLFAVALHIVFLASFVYHRSRDFELHHMVPSWFVPPVGIVVADVAFSGNPNLQWVANGALYFGLGVYAVMLPTMIYRLIFTHEIPDAAKPTLAIMAAPASLSLAGYLTVAAEPSPVILALLFGIAVLMTMIIYLAFIKLLRLPFSPGYAAFTFPMVIGATALYKLVAWMGAHGIPESAIQQVRMLANIELIVATIVVSYVAVRYLMAYLPKPSHQAA
ncbi:TDT family transporter [Vibrio mediterranei]|uniref:C4-dicarboxylate ABC transporter n=1 Tax=Vibrio mediterranei TaxID=689 RepID=A0AAN1KLV7_9VIBR|nr:TDT family transporter [Vibrio mediterranei]ASI88785.1 C4-dicarboxylate ABC transporter [Vibrio mediterranei]